MAKDMTKKHTRSVGKAQSAGTGKRSTIKCRF